MAGPPASRYNKPAALFPMMAGGLGVTCLLVLAFRFGINPYFHKKKRQEAENYANNLWDMQHAPKSESESYVNK